MKRNKIISILEYSARNKILVGILAVSLIGAGGVFLSSNAAISNNTIGINKTVLAGTLNNDGNKACVINGNANLVLHTSASNSNIQSYISVGEMLTINSYSNGYYNVTVQETGATGYIASSNMQKIVSGVGYDLTSLSGTGYVTNVSTVVNLRENATMNSETLAKLKNNTSVTLLGKQGDWYKVNDNGTTGYIYGEYIAIANTSTTSNSSSSSSATSSNSSSSSTKATSSKSSTSGTTSSNSAYSSYFGSWTININPAETIEDGIGNGSSSFPETIFLNKSEFIYGNQVIKNPVYKIVNKNSSYFLGNAQFCPQIFGENGTNNVKVLIIEDPSNTNNNYSFIIYNNKLLTSNGLYFYGYTLSNSSTAGIVGSTKDINCNEPTTSSSTSSRTGVAYINQPTGNGLAGIYEGPSGNTTLETALESGTKVTVLGAESGFYKIEYGNNEIGYVPARYLSFNKPESSSSSSSSTTGTTTKSTSGTTSNTGSSSHMGSNYDGNEPYKIATVNVNSVNVRESANINSSILVKLSKNTEVEVLSEYDGWYKIYDSNGQMGYIYHTYLTVGSKTYYSAGVGGHINNMNQGGIPDNVK